MLYNFVNIRKFGSPCNAPASLMFRNPTQSQLCLESGRQDSHIDYHNWRNQPKYHFK